MPSYLLSFRTPNDYAATPDTRVAWNKFFGEISTHLEDIGSPIFGRKEVRRQRPVKLLLWTSCESWSRTLVGRSFPPTAEAGSGLK
jgi:hypothetical protein